MAADKVSSNAIIKIDGTTLKVKPGCKVKLGNPTREPVVDSGGGVAFKEERKPGGFEFTVIAAGSFDLSVLTSLDGGTVTAEFLDSGKVYTGGNAVVMNDLEIADGEISVQIACNQVIEQ